MTVDGSTWTRAGLLFRLIILVFFSGCTCVRAVLSDGDVDAVVARAVSVAVTASVIAESGLVVAVVSSGDLIFSASAILLELSQTSFDEYDRSKLSPLLLEGVKCFDSKLICGVRSRLKFTSDMHKMLMFQIT